MSSWVWRVKSGLARTGTVKPVSRERIVRREQGDTEIFIFSVQPTSSRIGNLAWIDPCFPVSRDDTYIRDMGGKRKKCRKERIGSVAANPDNLGSNKEAGGGAQGAQGSSKICTSRESVSPLSRLTRGFCNKYH